MHWYRLYRARVIVTVDDFHGAPLQLVQKAANQQKLDRREAARGRGDAFNEYWCVFDRDQHPKLPDAMQLAAARGIMVAFSNPCIELWFLLHFTDQRAELDTRTAQRCAERHLGVRKQLTPSALDQLVARHDQARDRAQALDRKHSGDSNVPFGTSLPARTGTVVARPSGYFSR